MMTQHTLETIIDSIANSQSELIQAARAVAKRPDNILGLLTRDLSREEIAIMEGRGCHCGDWSLVQVAEDFDAFRVRRSHFVGHCVLGRFSGEVEILPGMSLPTGIYGCTIKSCHIGNNCLLENVRFAANIVVRREAVIFDVGSIVCSENARFGCAQYLPIALEVGGRDVPVWADMRIDDAAVIARQRSDKGLHQQLRQTIEDYGNKIACSFSFVERGAIIRHTERILDTYVGEGALIDHALEICNAAILSTAEESTRVNGGAAVTDALLQWGAHVGGNGIVRHAAMLEHSGVDADGIVETSIIGPNTSIEKGEVTASLVGPFVGFHHQSLLIAALWPEGRGNIAYGAMVGSNHTSRAPDQEIWPGEGVFYGLGASIRFPSNFSEAQYSVIGAGVSTLPQRMSFPFSSINTPIEIVSADQVPRAYNELLPGYGISFNAYAIERMEIKLAQRDRSKRHTFHYQVLRPLIMKSVLTALKRLEAVTDIKDIYLDHDIVGIGKNFLRETSRQIGIESYRRVLTRYALRVVLAEAESHQQIEGSIELANELLIILMPDTTRDQQLTTLIEVEKENAEIVEKSKSKDDVRGAKIFDDYADAHAPASEDEVVRSAWARVQSTSERVEAVLDQSK